MSTVQEIRKRQFQKRRQKTVERFEMANAQFKKENLYNTSLPMGKKTNSFSTAGAYDSDFNKKYEDLSKQYNALLSVTEQTSKQHAQTMGELQEAVASLQAQLADKAKAEAEGSQAERVTQAELDAESKKKKDKPVGGQ